MGSTGAANGNNPGEQVGRRQCVHGRRKEAVSMAVAPTQKQKKNCELSQTVAAISVTLVVAKRNNRKEDVVLHEAGLQRR